MSGGEATTLGKRERDDEDEDHPMNGASAAKVQPTTVGSDDGDDDDDDIGPMPMPDGAEETVQAVRKKRKGTSVKKPIICTTFANN